LGAGDITPPFSTALFPAYTGLAFRVSPGRQAQLNQHSLRTTPPKTRAVAVTQAVIVATPVACVTGPAVAPSVASCYWKANAWVATKASLGSGIGASILRAVFGIGRVREFPEWQSKAEFMADLRAAGIEANRRTLNQLWGAYKNQTAAEFFATPELQQVVPRLWASPALLDRINYYATAQPLTSGPVQFSFEFLKSLLPGDGGPGLPSPGYLGSREAIMGAFLPWCWGASQKADEYLRTLCPPPATGPEGSLSETDIVGSEPTR